MTDFTAQSISPRLHLEQIQVICLWIVTLARSARSKWVSENGWYPQIIQNIHDIHDHSSIETHGFGG